MHYADSGYTIPEVLTALALGTLVTLLTLLFLSSQFKYFNDWHTRQQLDAEILEFERTFLKDVSRRHSILQFDKYIIHLPRSDRTVNYTGMEHEPSRLGENLLRKQVLDSLQVMLLVLDQRNSREVFLSPNSAFDLSQPKRNRPFLFLEGISLQAWFTNTLGRDSLHLQHRFAPHAKYPYWLHQCIQSKDS